MPEQQLSRRKFIQAAGTAAVSASALSDLSSAEETEEGREQPEYIYYDEPTLDRFKPYLITTDTEFEPTLHGFIADGEQAERDTSVCVYAARYPYQKGYSSLDSHAGDREWYYVYVKNLGTTDEYIERIDYSAYHWLRGSTTDPPTTSGGNPVAYVYNKHHHYSHQQAKSRYENAPESATEYAVEDLTQSFPDWLENGLDDPLAPNVVYEPWEMLNRSSWWDDRGFLTFNTMLAQAWYYVGIKGADGADL